MTDINWTNELLGLGWENAKQRLQQAGVAFFVTELYGRKGPVEGADSLRVIRCQHQHGALKIVLSAFRTLPKQQPHNKEDTQPS